MERVLDLTLKLADEGLSPDEQQELERLIEAEPLARRKHVQMLEVEAALRAAKHARSADVLATTPSTSALLERRVTAVLQTIRRPRLPRAWVRRTWIGGSAALAAAAALLIFWPPARHRSPGPQAGPAGALGRLSSARPGRHEVAGQGRGWSTAVMAMQGAPPADHVSLDLGDGARLEVRGRAVLGIERPPSGSTDEGVANRVILEEGTVSYRRDGPAALRTAIVTPQANLLLQGGRAVVNVSAEGTRLYLTEGGATIATRLDGRGTPVSGRQVATISARGDLAVTAQRSALHITGGRKADVPTRFLDGAIARRFETLGFAVETVDEHELRAEHLQGRALMFISPSVSSALHGRIQELAIHNTSTPIVCSQPTVYAELGMTGPGRTNAEFSERKRHVSIADDGHPLAAGLAGDVELLGATMPLGWGIPATSATRVAVFRDRSERSAIFAYDRDDPMYAPAGRAAARRVGFFLHPTAARFLSDKAWTLFDAAVKWAADDTP